MGIPAVVVTVTGFKKVAQEAAEAAGIEGMAIAEYPGAVGVHLSEIRDKIKKVLFDQIVAGLTKPERGVRPGPGSGWDSREIVFRGTLEEVNQFFLQNEWTDGLPIIPPTLERVEKFLRWTNYTPDAEIAVLPQANLRKSVV